MKAIKTMTILKRALALAAIVAMTGTASAKNAPSGGVPGDLSPDRTSATVTVSAQCDSVAQGVSGALSVYIFSRRAACSIWESLTRPSPVPPLRSPRT